MPWLITLIGASWKFLAAYAVTRLFLAIGLSYVTYTGFSTIKDDLYAQITTNFGSLGADVAGILGLAGVDVAVSILFSAVTIRLLISGVSAGARTALRIK